GWHRRHADRNLPIGHTWRVAVDRSDRDQAIRPLAHRRVTIQARRHGEVCRSRTRMTNPRSIHVIRPGLLTTVQDLGRWGFQSQGVPVAGPMDPFSHRFANALVGNPREAAALEITLIGPELEFESDCVVAIGGAEFVVTLGGVAMPHAQSFRVPSRSRIQFGARLRGARAYLAVDGGIDVPLGLG